MKGNVLTCQGQIGKIASLNLGKSGIFQFLPCFFFHVPLPTIGTAFPSDDYFSE